jgi:ABC-type amino acid transport system permease subunit
VFAVADTMRQALKQFPRELVVAGRVCGLSPFQVFRHIQFPIVLRHTIPTLLMIQVNMLQASLFASLISVEELFRVAQRINAAEYKPVEIYTGLALFFLMICLPLNGIALMLQRHYGRNMSDR